MLYYFNGGQIDKLKEIVSSANRDGQSYGNSIAKRILERVDFNKLHISDGNVLTISDGRVSIKDYNCYDDKECAQIEDEIKAEIKNILGVDSSVKFYISSIDEEEPDPIPPMYWGTLDTVYYYSLIIRIML